MMADVYKPHVSGVTNHIDLTKRTLETLGHDVFVFTFGDTDYPDDEPNVIRSPGMPLVDTGYYISLRYTSTARRLLRTMDVVHVHHPFLSGSLALRYCRPRSIPIVFTNHTRYDLYLRAYLPNLPGGVGETFLRAYLPNFCRAIDLTIAPSPGMREVLQSLGVDTPIEVVPNGVDLSPYQRELTPFPRRQLGLNDNDVVLIYVGRLAAEKNLTFLIRSFAGVAEAYDHVHLVLVGDGPIRDDLEDRVRYMGMRRRIHFAGMVPYEQVPAYLAMADAFVTASVTEVHPLSVIEAMAAGLPVLGIHSPGVGDTVEDQVTGYLTNEEMSAFTARMVRLVTEHEERRRMGEAARQAAQRYAVENAAQLLIDHYRHLVAKARPRQHGIRHLWARFVEHMRQ